MASRLIVNADDFGLTTGVNRAVEELHRAGSLTSATLMANGLAFEDAARIARREPTLGVGCHIVLTDGTPVSPPECIPSLLGPRKTRFRSSLLDFVRAALTGGLREDEIRIEVQAQILKIERAGVRITHVDTHKHAHLFPSVSGPILEILRRSSIRAIRNPFEQRWSLALGGGSWLRRSQVQLLGTLQRAFLANPLIQSRSIVTTDGTIGISATGRLDETTLQAIYETIPPGTWELVCHPGYNDADLDAVKTRLREHRDIERNALAAVLSRSPVGRDAPALINFSDL